MQFPIEWSLWSVEQILEALPDYSRRIVERIEDFFPEHREKNLRAVASLASHPPTPSEVRDGIRRGEIATVAFAVDVLGRSSAAEGNHAEAVHLFQGAHEFFRQGNAAMRPSRPMQQSVSNALDSYAPLGMEEVAEGRLDVGELRDHLIHMVSSAWGTTPPQFLLSIDERLLEQAEKTRTELEPEPMEHMAFVRANVEHVLALDAPSRLTRVREHWHWLGQDMAPTATFRAVSSIQRPTDLAELLPEKTWTAIRVAVDAGDLAALAEALGPREEPLTDNLLLRLPDELLFREPATELRFRNQTDRFFEEAKGLLLRGDPRALDKFRNIHFHRRTHTAAKEWYAYALSRYGRPTDIYEIIHLLQATVESPYFRLQRGWTARWNLAAALQRVPSREHEALEVLLPVLDNVEHPAEALDHCLRWALSQDAGEILDSLLLRSRYHEAHLLAVMRDVRKGEVPPHRANAHFRRTGRILQNPDHIFPDPREELSFADLDLLTRSFIESGLVDAGVEWFRQRLSYGTARRMFKNWECAARLSEEAGDRPAAWICRQRQWECTRRQRGLDQRRKGAALRSLLQWAMKNGFGGEARHVLAEGWRHTAMEEPDVLLWEERLGTAPPMPLQDGAVSLQELRLTPPDELGVELFEPQAGDSYHSRIIVGFENKGDSDLPALSVQALADEPGLMFPGAVTSVPALPSGGSCFVEIPVEVMAGSSGSVGVRFKVRAGDRGGRPLEQPGSVLLSGVWSPPEPLSPAPLTEPVGVDAPERFLGREELLETLRADLDAGRLIWLEGPPGIGKSSLLRRIGDGRSERLVLLDLRSLPVGREITPIHLVRHLARALVDALDVDIDLPGAADFDLDPPFTVFGDFVRRVRRTDDGAPLLFGVDGVDTYARRVAEDAEALDSGLLQWLGQLPQIKGVSAVLAGDEPLVRLRALLPTVPLWAKLTVREVEPLAGAVVEREAVNAAAAHRLRWLPVARTALRRAVDGRPWRLRGLLETIVRAVSEERRLVIGPADVARAQDLVGERADAQELEARENVWGGEVTPPDAITGDSVPSVEEEAAQVARRAAAAKGEETSELPPLALMVDWENVKISLLKALEELPADDAERLRPRLDSESLALGLVDLATNHGVPRQRWAVAAWDRPAFSGDQRSLKSARFWTDIAGDLKADASDHVLREKIHYVLREHDDIDVYVIATGDADFTAVVETLLGQGRQVVLWATRDNLSDSYKRLLGGPAGLKIEWLDDLVFGSEGWPSDDVS